MNILGRMVDAAPLIILTTAEAAAQKVVAKETFLGGRRLKLSAGGVN